MPSEEEDEKARNDPDYAWHEVPEGAYLLKTRVPALLDKLTPFAAKGLPASFVTIEVPELGLRGTLRDFKYVVNVLNAPSAALLRKVGPYPPAMDLCPPDLTTSWLKGQLDQHYGEDDLGLGSGEVSGPEEAQEEGLEDDLIANLPVVSDVAARVPPPPPMANGAAPVWGGQAPATPSSVPPRDAASQPPYPPAAHRLNPNSAVFEPGRVEQTFYDPVASKQLFPPGPWDCKVPPLASRQTPCLGLC